MDHAAQDLDQRIRRFIARSDATEIGFERLALDVFSYQYERNEPYRRYCRQAGRKPDGARRWRDIPAVPVASFADARLACFPPERSMLSFVSSGTTTTGLRPSRHELETSELYDASLLAHFKAQVLPDAASMTLIALAPKFEDAPHSSLSYMMSKISVLFGTARDGFYIRNGELDFDGVARSLEHHAEPVMLFGTATAFLELMDRFDEEKKRFALPLGSRIIETGGLKGRSREIIRDELYERFSRMFGVPRVLCLSEYGMCELGSQWYDANLCDYFTGRKPRTELKIGPHWARALVVDPVSAEPLPKGSEGLLRFFDLANRSSVAALLSGDLAREENGGFVMLGRFDGAPPKGCSLALEAMLRGDDP